MKGIDISSWQRGIPSAALNSVDFAILKIAEGSSWVDPCFDEFYSMAKIPLGAYVYSHATTETDAVSEARFALSLIKGRYLPLGVYIDVEEQKQLCLPDATLTAVVKAFCDTIRAGGYIPGAYGSAGNLWAKVGSRYLGENVLVWVAQWGGKPTFGDLWQYSADARVAGYSGAVDGDEALSERFKLMINGHAPAPTPEPEADKPTTPYWPPRTLCFGMEGADVYALQSLLLARGYDCSPSGIFDVKTKSAVLEYQGRNGLDPDGIPGPMTWQKLLSRW